MTQAQSNADDPLVIAAATLVAQELAAQELPPHLVKRLPAHLLERCVDLAEMHADFYQDAIARQGINRARMGECITAYGRLRIDILTALGADLKSGDLLPMPVLLQDH
jgi:hypothetical protein